MANINQIVISGVVGINPELKATQTGKRITNFTVGCKSRYGENAPTDWFKVIAFDSTAEYVQRYGKKSDFVVVVGSLHKNEWVDNKQNVHKDYEIWANSVEIKSKQQQQQQQQTFDQSSNNNPFKPAGINVTEVTDSIPDAFDDDDKIPF